MATRVLQGVPSSHHHTVGSREYPTPKRDMLILSTFDAKECYRTVNKDAPVVSRMSSLLGRSSSSRVASNIPTNLGGSASEILMQSTATLAPTSTLKRKKTFSMFTEAEQKLNAWAPQPTLGRIRDLLSSPPPLPPSQLQHSSHTIQASNVSLRLKERTLSPSSSLRGGRSVALLGDGSLGAQPSFMRHSTLPSLQESQTAPSRKSMTPPPTLTPQHLVSSPSHILSQSSASLMVQAATPPGRIRPVRNSATVGEKPHTASTHSLAHTPPPTKSLTFTSSSTTSVSRQPLQSTTNNVSSSSPTSATHQQPARVAARNAKEGVANRGTDSLPPLSDWALKRIQ